MCYRMILSFVTSFLVIYSMSFSACTMAETNQEMETWTYHKDFDKLNNLNFSYVRSPIPKLNLYDNIRLELICKDNKLQWITQANSLITSQGREFDFEYQIDKKPPVSVKFRTFKDNKRRGYYDDQIDRIAKELLSGQAIFIRISTIISSVLSAEISLKNAADPIQQVLADCSVAEGNTPSGQQTYSLDDFENDFAKLSSDQQMKVLDEIKKIMAEIR